MQLQKLRETGAERRSVMGEAAHGSIQMFSDRDIFPLGLWANWEYKDNVTIQTGFDSLGKIRTAGGSRHIVSVGIRPVVWGADNFAIRGAAGYCYIENVRNGSGTTDSF